MLIEGLTADEMLALPDEHIAALVAAGAVAFQAGSAEILGQVRLRPDSLMLDLAQIDGGGEGVLPVLWRLAERYARQRELDAVEWVLSTARAQTSSDVASWRSVAFQVRDVEGIGAAYYCRHQIKAAPSGA